MSVGKGQSSQSENGTVMKCTMTKFDNDAKKCRNMENRDMQRCRDETCNAKMQDAMQDTVHNEHKQMEMLMPPKVQPSKCVDELGIALHGESTPLAFHSALPSSICEPISKVRSFPALF